MRKICVFTGTRAEYGLLYWLMKDIQADTETELQLLVSGTHLSPEFGYTYKHIIEDGFIINEKVEMLLSSNSPTGVIKSIGLALIGFADALERLQPDIIVILGDRYEALAIAQAAMLKRIPIAHIHGGEITQGAYDDAIRHAITKLSQYHFTSSKEHYNRIIQLGEEPKRVFNTGAIGLDHVQRTTLMSREELQASLNFSLDLPYFIVTYHPVTLENEPAEKTIKELLGALEEFPNYKVIFTYPNADDGGRSIIPLIDHFGKKNVNRVCIVPSLGFKRYLSSLKYASCVIGNSSSALIEAPALRLPTVNIGVRQQGRLAAKSVFHCLANKASIVKAINKSLVCKHEAIYDNPYGSGDVSKNILFHLKQIKLDVVKKFHDIPESKYD
ncbi:UDP-N-acetylglucosamine 2-epimerase [Pantoea sp. FN0305]|uniref:UDP-N-acetylglucosamine 2-epimerase n=1 Tax=Pantoea sp. FN0305 TaxID=3418559 RepID=UPI003CE9FC30